jgi:hypothetical protein
MKASIILYMEAFIVPRTGLEPARPKSDTWPSTMHVYHFRHLGRMCAEGGTRTLMPLQAHVPETCASTSFATSAVQIGVCLPDWSGSECKYKNL